MSKTTKIRLFVDSKLTNGQHVDIKEEQSRYLSSVMRLDVGDKILLFNGKDGEFVAQLQKVGKKSVEVKVLEQTREFVGAEDIWLMFAPIKKDRTDFVIEKATELGVKKIIPTITRYTITDKAKKERFEAQAIEASEQSRRLDVPEIDNAVKLEDVLQNWDESRTLFFMDETGKGRSAIEEFSAHKGKAALLIGPEGGFAEEELENLRSKSYAQAVSLGPLILRAETAVAAALSIWQATAGSWSKKD